MCLRPLLCSMPILFLLWHLSTSATRSLHSIPLFLCQLLPVKFPIYGFLEGPAVSVRFVWLISWHKHCSVRISYCIVYRTAKQSLSKAGASTQWAVNPWSFTRQYRIFISYQGHIGSSVIRRAKRITHATNRSHRNDGWRVWLESLLRGLRRVALITSRPKFKLQKKQLQIKERRQFRSLNMTPLGCLIHSLKILLLKGFSIFNKEKKHEWSGELKQGSAQEKSYS